MATTKKGARVNILNRLRGMPSFHPVTTDLFSDWRLEAGDVITVTKKEGENPITGEPIEVSYGIPIFQMDLNWNGAPVVEVRSTGSKKRPDPAKLNRGGGYGGSRQKEETEIQLVRHQADITKTDERITLWATEAQWNALAQEYSETGRTQIDITSDDITSVVTQSGVIPGVKPFTPMKNYAVGDHVIWAGKTWVFTSAHTAGTAWDPTEVEEIKSQETRITQTENGVGLVVDSNGIRAGQIILAINGGTGHSEAKIEADQVLISGATTISDVLSITEGGYLEVGNIYIDSARLSSYLEVGYPEGAFTVNSSGEVQAESVACGSLTVYEEDINVADVQVNGNTLEITYVDGTTDTFSKATSLSGVWGSGDAFPLTVTATPQGNQYTVGFTSGLDASLELVMGSGAVTRNSAGIINVPLQIQTPNGQSAPTVRYTKSLAVGVSAVLTTPPTITPTSSAQTITAGSGAYANYIGFSSVTVGASSGGSRDEVVLAEIGFHNNSTATLLDNEPTEAPRWSGGTINGWFWLEQSDHKWKNLGYKQWSLPAAATGWQVVDTGSTYTCYCTVAGKQYSGTVNK